MPLHSEELDKQEVTSRGGRHIWQPNEVQSFRVIGDYVVIVLNKIDTFILDYE